MEYSDVFLSGYDTTIINNDDKLSDFKQIDRGHNVIFRFFTREDGTLKKTKINIYTSSGTGSNIRDGETGVYYNSLVGSLDEELFYKVVLSTGECNSPNGSSTMFFLSPKHYMSHMHVVIDDESIARWEERRAYRIKVNNKRKSKNRNIESIVVN